MKLLSIPRRISFIWENADHCEPFKQQILNQFKKEKSDNLKHTQASICFKLHLQLLHGGSFDFKTATTKDQT